jgi:hypothetical protein
MSVRMTADPLAQMRGQRAVMLTIRRRDGRPVATPAGHGIDGPTLSFVTDPGTAKVKRLPHTQSTTRNDHVDDDDQNADTQETS